MTTRTIYTAKLKGIGKFRFAGNMVEASATIYNVDDEDGEETLSPTPYQTADARHRPTEALKLALKACGREFFAEPGDDREDDEIVDELCDDVEVRS